MVSLDRALDLLEHLTISTGIGLGVPFAAGPLRFGSLSAGTKSNDRHEWRSANEYVYRAAADAARRQWIEWCFAPLDRDDQFLADYRLLLRKLTALASSGRELRYVLQELVDTATGLLELDSWSSELPRDWKTRCPREKSPSDWAEFLAAFKYRTNTRAIKERLRDANFEQSVRAAWLRYGEWLRQHPEAIHELERAMGELRVDLTDDPSMGDTSIKSQS